MDVVKSAAENRGSKEATREGAAPRRDERTYVVAPPVDVYEGDDAILVVVDVPGVAPDDLTVRYEKDEIVVQGRRAVETSGAPRVEYRRAFGLPPDVDGEGVVASLSRGVLELRLPRKSSAKPRRIPVRAA